ncbi:MAG: DUF1987 domain-containing protein [Sulfuritalea sp.]|nr:DUF1987 domain-containing protein [Sulfuritalea sp.]
MEDLHIPAGAETPAIRFEYSRHRLGVHGASFPCNAMSIYGPLQPSLHDYLQTLPAESRIEVSVGLRYFSRSSATLVRSLFKMLDQRARAGLSIAVVWRHSAGDELARDFGLDLRDEHPYLQFRTIVSAE